MSLSTASRPQSIVGRTRFGGGSLTLLVAALLIGLVVAAGLGGLFAWLGDAGDPWLRFVVATIVALPIGIALGWVVLVDRSSLRGATERPDDSVENTWFARAAVGTLGDVFATVGLAAGVLAITQLQVDVVLLLLALEVGIGLDLFVRYWVAKRKDG